MPCVTGPSTIGLARGRDQRYPVRWSADHSTCGEDLGSANPDHLLTFGSGNRLVSTLIPFVGGHLIRVRPVARRASAIRMLLGMSARALLVLRSAHPRADQQVGYGSTVTVLGARARRI
jgi:hypothetical protein